MNSPSTIVRLAKARPPICISTAFSPKTGGP